MNWHWALLPIAMLACGFGYRVRGGWLEAWHIPGQVSRLVFAVAAGLTAYAAGAVWWIAAALVPAFWISTTVPLFNAIDLGANEGAFWSDFLLLMLRGLLAVAVADAVLWWFGYPHWWALIPAGLAMGPLYWAGRQLRVGIKGFGAGHDFPETGEFLTGLSIGLGTFLAVVV